MGIFIGNLAYSIIEIVINVELLEKVLSFRIYNAFPNSLVILEKYFSPCMILFLVKLNTDNYSRCLTNVLVRTITINAAT